MAKRFVLASTGKYRDTWFRRLDFVEKHAWNYLTQYPEETHTGIIERLPEDLAHESQIPLERWESIMQKFENDGKIIRFGQDFIWVKSFIEHQIRSETFKKDDNRIGPAITELERLEPKCEPLVRGFRERYFAEPKPLHSPSKGASATRQDKKAQDKKTISLAGPAAPAEFADLLAKAEARLPDEDCRTAWSNLKREMQLARKAPLRDKTTHDLLDELLASIAKHSLSPEAAAHGIRACAKAHPPAENERYFRKAALGYRPDAPAPSYQRPARPFTPELEMPERAG